VVDALSGLHAAHGLKDDNGKPLNIVHRDVSPHNVLIGCDGRSHITDFGIAKAEDRIQTTRTHEVKGKLAYLAPERIDRRRLCTIQSDLFSMAVVLWECFAGRRLFRAEEAVDILQEVMVGPIPTLKQIGAPIPQELDDVVARALSRDLDTRFATALEFAQAIERSVGTEHVGTTADVARLMEAIFGPRMAMRQEQVRATIGSSNLAQLLRESGLRARERTLAVGVPTGQLLAELAPPAPTGRYVLGTGLSGRMNRLASRRVPWRSLATVVGGVATGALVTLAVVSHRSRPAPEIALPPARTASSTVVVQGLSLRRVVLPLPFLSTHVAFDDDASDLTPATDVAAFDVPRDSGMRHRVIALALDGTRAEGYVLEQDGVARPDGDGFAIIGASHPRSADERRGATGARSTRGLGTVHDGFTKLR
jgi:eukaryotic-like serine/threonine-protein kinase